MHTVERTNGRIVVSFDERKLLGALSGPSFAQSALRVTEREPFLDFFAQEIVDDIEDQQAIGDEPGMLLLILSLIARRAAEGGVGVVDDARPDREQLPLNLPVADVPL